MYNCGTWIYNPEKIHINWSIQFERNFSNCTIRHLKFKKLDFWVSTCTGQIFIIISKGNKWAQRDDLIQDHAKVRVPLSTGNRSRPVAASSNAVEFINRAFARVQFMRACKSPRLLILIPGIHRWAYQSLPRNTLLSFFRSTGLPLILSSRIKKQLAWL